MKPKSQIKEDMKTRRRMPKITPKEPPSMSFKEELALIKEKTGYEPPRFLSQKGRFNDYPKGQTGEEESLNEQKNSTRCTLL